jgi:hypothetical protein
MGALDLVEVDGVPPVQRQQVRGLARVVPERLERRARGLAQRRGRGDEGREADQPQAQGIAPGRSPADEPAAFQRREQPRDGGDVQAGPARQLADAERRRVAVEGVEHRHRPRHRLHLGRFTMCDSHASCGP